MDKQQGKEQRDGLRDMADAHDFLLGFLLFHLAPFFIDPERTGSDSEFLQKLKNGIHGSALSEGAKEWANNVLLSVEMSWTTYMQQRNGNKPQ